MIAVLVTTESCRSKTAAAMVVVLAAAAVLVAAVGAGRPTAAVMTEDVIALFPVSVTNSCCEYNAKRHS